MHFEIPKLNAPGLKSRRNKDGSTRLYWCARTDIRKRGYEPETVRLHYDLADPLQHRLIEAACQRYQAEMLEWSSGRGCDRRAFDGTIASLVRAYETDPASPYAEVKWNTRRTYGQVLAVIERAFGKRTLSALGITDFRRWYDEAKKPKGKDSPERINKANRIIAMLRRLFAYGVMAELAECARLKAILEEARFKQPARRRVRLELHHVEAFIAAAKAAGRHSLALGTALQFETGMRQRDGIGEWEPIRKGTAATGIVLGVRRWVNGLTWADLGSAMVISKATTKTGAIVSHDLKLCPRAGAA